MTLLARNIIDQLSGVVAGSPIDVALSARSGARRAAQATYEHLFHREDADASLFERRALAAFAAALEDEPENVAHFHTLLETGDPSGGRLTRIVLWEALLAAAPGPYGRLSDALLSADDLDGPVYRPSALARQELGARLAAALEYLHLLIRHPRDANEVAHARLVGAGWSDEGIGLIAEIAGFIGFQARIVAGLRAVAASRIDGTRAN